MIQGLKEFYHENLIVIAIQKSTTKWYFSLHEINWFPEKELKILKLPLFR